MAAQFSRTVPTLVAVSTHSHPKVAASSGTTDKRLAQVSTHSHPKVAAYQCMQTNDLLLVSTHSHPKVAAYSVGLMQINSKFQHTATRRWLLGQVVEVKAEENVSTHSHPKVAAPYIKKQEKSAN